MVDSDAPFTPPPASARFHKRRVNLNSYKLKLHMLGGEGKERKLPLSLSLSLVPSSGQNDMKKEEENKKPSKNPASVINNIPS